MSHFVDKIYGNKLAQALYASCGPDLGAFSRSLAAALDFQGSGASALCEEALLTAAETVRDDTDAFSAPLRGLVQGYRVWPGGVDRIYIIDGSYQVGTIGFLTNLEPLDCPSSRDRMQIDVSIFSTVDAAEAWLQCLRENTASRTAQGVTCVLPDCVALVCWKAAAASCVKWVDRRVPGHPVERSVVRPHAEIRDLNGLI